MVAVASCSTASDSPSSISSAEVRDWLQKTPVLKGEKWFVVSAEWFTRFLRQFEELSDTQFAPKKPGKMSPIDNSELLDENHQIRRNLIQDIDYQIIPEECWERLVSEYKMTNGQKPISVSIVQHGDALGPELFLYHVTLKQRNSTEKSERKYSKTTTMKEIEDDMRQFFHLSRDDYPEARLKLQPMSDCEWIPVEDKAVALMDTGASESSVIEIDVENRNYSDWNRNLAVCVRNEDLVNGSTMTNGSVPSPTSSTAGQCEMYGPELPPNNVEPMDTSTVNGVASDMNSDHQNGSTDVYGPSTLAQHLEQEACYDISRVVDSSTQAGSSYSYPLMSEDSSTQAVTGLSFPSVPDDKSIDGVKNDTAIPLPYGPLPLNADSGAIPLPYGPLAPAETSYFNSNVEEKSDPGVCGLRNLGNSCYMNAALQCLSNVKILSEYFLSDEWKEDINVENKMGLEGKLATEYAYLIRDLWSGNYKSISPTEMKKIAGQKDKQFMGSLQHDSQELMSAVLDGLHEDLKRPTNEALTNGNGCSENHAPAENLAEESKRKHRQRENSRIVDLFHGYQKSTVICRKCLNESETYDPFSMLSLPLPGGNLCRLDITFISLEDPQKKPVRHTIEVESSGSVSDLLTKVAEITKSDVSRLWAAQVCNCKVNQRLESTLPIIGIYDMFYIYVYEKPSPSSNGLNGKHDEDESEAMDECSLVDGEIIVNGTGDSTDSDTKVDGIQPVVVNMIDNVYNLPFGQPIVYFPSEGASSISVEELAEHVMRLGGRYIQSPSSEDIAERWWKDRPYGQQSSGASSSVASSTNNASSSLPDLRATSSVDDDRGTAAAAAASSTNGAIANEVEEEPPMFTLSEIDDQGNRHRLESGATISLPGDKMIRMTAVWHRRAKLKFYNDTEANSVQYASSTTMSTSSPKVTTLSECLDLLTSEDRLDGSNAVECTKCPKTEDGRLARCPATKKIDLWELPPVLILHLKRFMFMTHTTKPEIDVKIPISDLSLQPWVKGPHCSSTYDLVAVSNHSGRTLERGHYTAFAKNWKNDNWYRFDDDLVTETESNIDGELAYILVYVRREVDDAPTNGEQDMEIA